ncbi:MAG: C39 family peptidase [Elusimicrobiota bacterium]
MKKIQGLIVVTLMVSLTIFSGCDELKIFGKEEKKQEYFPERKVLEGINIIGQKGDGCAWASAEMVLKYYGYDVSQETIGQMTCKDTVHNWERGLTDDLFDRYTEIIEQLSDNSLEVEQLSVNDKQETLNQIKNAIFNDNPIILMSNGGWLIDFFDYIKHPINVHASVIVGYSLNSREVFVKELPILGVSPPAIKLYDPATVFLDFGAYWLNFATFYKKTTDGSFLRLWEVKERVGSFNFERIFF